MGLIISNKQLGAIQTQINDINIDEYVAFLQEKHPDKYNKTRYNELCELVQQGIKLARKYRINNLENIKTFISYCTVYPLDISRYPILEQELKHYSKPEAYRIEKFYLSLLSGR